MTIALEADAHDMIGALSRCRHGIMERANALLNDPAKLPLTERYDALPSVASLLMTALKELQVAEDELRAQNAKLEEQRVGIDEQIRYYRLLFRHIPEPAIITDRYGSIREVNAAATVLLRREAPHLDHKPISILLPADGRDDFRTKLARLAVTDCVRDWHLTMKRSGDLPVTVAADVSIIPGLGETGSGMLFWLLRVVDTSN